MLLVVGSLVASACESRTEATGATAVVPASLAGPTAAVDDTSTAGMHATGTPPPAVPPLLFADNPDPTQCGIPMLWGNDEPAWITGIYQGSVFQPVVYLYESHGRREVVGRIPHGGRVRIVLTQANPALNYYFVRSLDLQPAQGGWIPAPFVALDAPPPPLP